MKGYKAFDKDLKCRDFQYEIGQTYEIDGEIECCERGFHFCKDLSDCYRFYEMTDDTRICEVEAIGEIIHTHDSIKYCTNKIKILSEVENPKIKTNVSTLSSGYCNTGVGNTGNRNSGDRNTGDYNSGNWNAGTHNSGIMNSGNWNTGCRNTGHCNSGSMNSGDWNSGTHNSGNMNCGDWNSGNCNTGVFNCEEPKIRMFDKESDWTLVDWYSSRAYMIMYVCPCTYSYYGEDQEKTIVHKATAEDRQKWWDGLSEDDKNAVKSLPNFDADKFYICTGIKV